MRFKSVFIFFIVIISFGAANAQDFKAKAEEYINQRVENDQFSGNIIVAKAGKILYMANKGYASYTYKIKHTPASRFRIGSITKQFTAFAVLFMVERGEIKLTDHISDYIPDYPKPNGDKITIHQLLTHTSGIPNYTADEDLFNNRGCLTGSTDEFIKNFWDKPLDFTPGSKFSYSNSGYYLLSVILDKINNNLYEETLQKIFERAQMTDTGLEHYQEVIPNLSTGYARIGRRDQVKQSKFIKVDLAAYGAGAMYSTAADLYKWHIFLNNQDFISPELLEKYFTPEKDNYAYGWLVSNIKGHPIQWHNGGIDGFVSYIARYPQDDLFITVLSNYEGAPMDQIGMDLAKMYFGEAVAPPVPPKEVKVDPSIYDAYTGTYNLAPGFDIVVTKEDNHLMLQATGQEKFEVFPESETLFFLKVVEAKVEFLKGEDGKVSELILHQNGEHKGVKQ